MRRSALLGAFLAIAGFAAAQTNQAPSLTNSAPTSLLDSGSDDPLTAATPPPNEAAKDYVPDIARAAAAAGNNAFAHSNYKTAREAYERLLKLAPDNLLGLVNLGLVEYTTGDVKDAEPLLRKAVQLRIETAPAWLTLGLIYIDQNRLDEALAALAEAALYDPKNPRIHNYLGVVFGRKGWIDAAEAELREALTIDPDYSDANYNLAVFYLEKTPPSIELARRHYYRAIQLGAPPDQDIEKTLKANPPPPTNAN
jgi:tetratricopeptide (TPR) repeat protein